MVIPEKAAPVTRTTLRTTGPVPADFAIGTQLRGPDKLGTDPMAVDGIEIDAVAKIGRNPVSKKQIHPECGE